MKSRVPGWKLDAGSSKLVWALAAAGALLRLRQYASGRSLWLDETLLALNLIRRPPEGLLRPLEYHQQAPVGFLLLEKLAITLFGSSEAALRVVPLLAGLASLILFVCVGARLLGNRALALATALFAVSAPLVYYAAEVKQYSSDVAVALLLLAAALPALREGLSGRRAAVLAAGGAVVIWFSHPAVFVLAAIGTVLGIRALGRSDRAEARRVLVLGIVWSVSFAASWVLILRHSSADARIVAYWSGSFLPLPPRSLADLVWPISAFFGVFGNPVGLRLAGLGALAFLAGCAARWNTERARLALLILPGAFALAASAVRRYPFEGRFLLFFVPSVLFVVAAGWDSIARRIGGSRVFAALFAGLLLLHPMLRAAESLIRPQTHQESRAVLEEIRRRASPEDRIYGYRSAPQFEYYLPRLGFDGSRYIGGRGAKRDWPEFSRDVERLPAGRVWIVFANLPPETDEDADVRFFLYALDQRGRRLASVVRPGAAAYLYELDAGDGRR